LDKEYFIIRKDQSPSTEPGLFYIKDMNSEYYESPPKQAPIKRPTKVWQEVDNVPLKNITSDLLEDFSYAAEDYFAPKTEEMRKDMKKISKFLKKGDYAIVVPMKEASPVVENLLVALDHVPRKNIYIINDRSDESATNAVKKFHGVRLVEKEEIIDLVDATALKEILNTARLPVGKGMTVFAGHLLIALISKFSKKPKWIFQHDAEIARHLEFTNIDYLAWATEKFGNGATHVKIAKFGRNNERTMTARSCLLALLQLPDSPENNAIKSRAAELFKNLAPMKWMLSGQFVSTYDIAISRPFATGYLEETLISAYVSDYNRSKNKKSLQVANPHLCLDGENEIRKEDRMLQMISNFLFTLAMHPKDMLAWKIEDIKNINYEKMSPSVPAAFIPNHDGPVEIEHLSNERIVPSVAEMFSLGIIDERRGKKLALYYS